MGHHEGRNGTEHRAVGRLVFEGLAEFRLFQHRDDLLCDAAAQENAATCHEDQRKVAGDAAEIGGKKRQRLGCRAVGAVETRRGDRLRRREGRVEAVGKADRPIEINETPAAQDLFCGNTPLDRLQMRKHGAVACRARPKIDMAAFAGHRNPVVAGIDQTGDAESRARAEHNPRRAALDFAGADGMPVFSVERRRRQGLCLEIIEHDDVVEGEILHHLPRAHDPGAIGQFDLVTVHRAGDGENRRTRLNRGLVEHAGLNRIVDGLEIGGRDNRKLFRLRVSVHQDGEAGIGAADVADQDGEMDRGVLVRDVGHVRSVSGGRPWDVSEQGTILASDTKGADGLSPGRLGIAFEFNRFEVIL